MKQAPSSVRQSVRQTKFSHFPPLDFSDFLHQANDLKWPSPIFEKKGPKMAKMVKIGPKMSFMVIFWRLVFVNLAYDDRQTWYLTGDGGRNGRKKYLGLPLLDYENEITMSGFPRHYPPSEAS